MSQPSVRAEIEAIEAKKIEPAKAGSCSSTAPVGHRARSLAALQSPSLDGPGKLPLRVEELSARGEIVQVMVYADHPMIPRAAFRATVQQYPKSRIRLRNRVLIMEEHVPD